MRSCAVKAYAAVLRVPHVAALIAATLLARFPIGINALALVLYLRAERGSFAVAGVVAGALAAGSGVGAPVQGRLVDAFGQRRVLVPLGIVHAAALGALVASTEAGAPAAVLVAFGFVAGFAIPPTSSVLRSMWPDLLRERPQLLQPAYALDSVLIELIFILGPLLTAVIATTLAPPAALAVSAISVIVGTVAFTALPPSRAFRPEPDRRPAGALGALASPGVRTLVLTSIPAGIGIGICEVALPAFSDASGAAATAGVLLALWSLGSAAGGLVYGALPNRPPLGRVHLMVAALLPLGLLPMALAPSVPVMALLVIPAGIFIAPLLATRNELVGWVAPDGARTEAYTWPVTAFVGGIAIGAAVAGAIVEGPGWRTAFVVAGAVAAVGTVIVAVPPQHAPGARDGVLTDGRVPDDRRRVEDEAGLVVPADAELDAVPLADARAALGAPAARVQLLDPVGDAHVVPRHADALGVVDVVVDREAVAVRVEDHAGVVVLRLRAVRVGLSRRRRGRDRAQRQRGGEGCEGAEGAFAHALYERIARPDIPSSGGGGRTPGIKRVGSRLARLVGESPTRSILDRGPYVTPGQDAGPESRAGGAG